MRWLIFALSCTAQARRCAPWCKASCPASPHRVKAIIKSAKFTEPSCVNQPTSAPPTAPVNCCISPATAAADPAKFIGVRQRLRPQQHAPLVCCRERHGGGRQGEPSAQAGRVVALNAGLLDPLKHFLLLFAQGIERFLRGLVTRHGVADVLPPQLRHLRIIRDVGAGGRPLHACGGAVELNQPGPDAGVIDVRQIAGELLVGNANAGGDGAELRLGVIAVVATC